MNNVILMGRVVADPVVRYGGVNNTAVARYRLAVNRRFKYEGQPDADFLNIVSFGKAGEFAEKYLRKGIKIVVEGELRNNNYTNQDGQMVYNVEIVTRNIEFAESKKAQDGDMDIAAAGGVTVDGDGFMNIPDGIEEELPFR